jgi:toxin YoeB
VKARPKPVEQLLAAMEPSFREDLLCWVEKDRKMALRVCRLVEAVMRDPFPGEGKPESLKGMPGT